MEGDRVPFPAEQRGPPGSFLPGWKRSAVFQGWDGEFASVYCVSLGKDGGRISYRFLDTYIRNPGDIPICFDDMESRFTGIIKALEGGRMPELP